MKPSQAAAEEIDEFEGLEILSKEQVAVLIDRHIPPPKNTAGIARWLLTGRTGTSSIYMASFYLAGELLEAPGGSCHPRDPHDLGRCMRLIEMVPEVRSILPLLKVKSPDWYKLVVRWDELETLHRRGVYADTDNLMNSPL